MLSEEVALLCPGFTGAEMKLLMKRSTSHCLNDEKNAITEIKNKRKNEEEKNEGKSIKENNVTNTIEENSVGNNEEKNEEKNEENNDFLFILTIKHFTQALLSVSTSVTPEEILEYETWAREKK